MSKYTVDDNRSMQLNDNNDVYTMKVGSLVIAVGFLHNKGDVGIVTYIGPWKDSIEVHVLYSRGLVCHKQCERMFKVIG